MFGIIFNVETKKDIADVAEELFEEPEKASLSKHTLVTTLTKKNGQSMVHLRRRAKNGKKDMYIEFPLKEELPRFLGVLARYCREAKRGTYENDLYDRICLFRRTSP